MAAGEFAGAAEAFMTSYKAAFESFDLAAVSAHLAAPGHAVSEGQEIGVLAVPDAATWTRLIGRIIGLYRTIGVATADIAHQEFVELSPRMGLAAMHWLLRDAAGAELYRFEATYTLVDAGEGLRIVAIANNEMPRFGACYARLAAEGKVAPPA